MLKIAAAGPLRTAASLHVSNPMLSGINHIALANSRFIQFENSTRLANDLTLDDKERAHHAQIARALSR